MAEKIISPGVFTKEIDASFLPAAVGDIGAVVVGPTVKGPALVPTVVNSYGEFQARFGDVFKSGSNSYQYLTSMAVKNYLSHQGTLTVCRVMADGYSHASASVGDTTVDVPAQASTATVTFDASVDAGETITIEDTAGRSVAYKAEDSEDLAADPPEFHRGAEPDGAASLKDAIESANGHNGTITVTQVAGELTLTQTVAGADGDTNILDSGTNWTIVDWDGGADIIDGRGDVAFTLHTLSHGEILNSLSSDFVSTNNILDSGSANNIRWEISSVNPKKGTFTLLIRRGDDTIKRKQIMETWNNCTLDPNAPNYIDKMVGNQYITQGGDDADPFLKFNGDFQNKSKYVRVVTTLRTVDYLDDNGKVRVPDASGSLPVVGSGSLGGSFQGGLDGLVTHPYNFNEHINAQTQGLTDGTGGFNNYKKALNLLANSDEYDFNLLLLPGIIRNQSNHTALISKAIEICEARGDAFFIADSVHWGENALGNVTDQAKAMDSNYTATYWPWIQSPDMQLGTNVWVPPSVSMAGIYAYNDKVGAPWFAPAGLNRGVITTAVQAKRKLTHGNRDELYEKNVNPIATFPGQGVVVWGQKTLQKKASAMDRVNVRRLLIKVKKFIASSSRFLVFEQNNAQTRERFLNIANPFLEQVQAQSGLNAFKVVMDESNNTPDIVDRNILYGQIFVQPTKTAEFIVLDFTIQPTGATFPE